MIGRVNVGGSGKEEIIARITLLVEGAKEDNIVITDSNGIKVGAIVFDSGATVGTLTILIKDGEECTFTSLVAKSTTDGISNYSKTVKLSKDTTSVKVMPSGALYWYGNECENTTGGISLEKISSNTYRGSATITKSTNSFTFAYPSHPENAAYSLALNKSAFNITNFNKMVINSSEISTATRYLNFTSGASYKENLRSYGDIKSGTNNVFEIDNLHTFFSVTIGVKTTETRITIKSIVFVE